MCTLLSRSNEKLAPLLFLSFIRYIFSVVYDICPNIHLYLPNLNQYLIFLISLFPLIFYLCQFLFSKGALKKCLPVLLQLIDELKYYLSDEPELSEREIQQHNEVI